MKLHVVDLRPLIAIIVTESKKFMDPTGAYGGTPSFTTYQKSLFHFATLHSKGVMLIKVSYIHTRSLHYILLSTGRGGGVGPVGSFIRNHPTVDILHCHKWVC